MVKLCNLNEKITATLIVNSHTLELSNDLLYDPESPESQEFLYLFP